MNLHEDLLDLIIYSLEDYETIDKFSAEHITTLVLDKDFLLVDSAQRCKPCLFTRSAIGFHFQAR